MKQVKSYNPDQTYLIPFNPFESFRPNSLEITIHNIIEKHISIKPFLIHMSNKNKGKLQTSFLLRSVFLLHRKIPRWDSQW